jgi:hypothetical protein
VQCFPLLLLYTTLNIYIQRMAAGYARQLLLFHRLFHSLTHEICSADNRFNSDQIIDLVCSSKISLTHCNSLTKFIVVIHSELCVFVFVVSGVFLIIQLVRIVQWRWLIIFYMLLATDSLMYLKSITVFNLNLIEKKFNSHI